MTPILTAQILLVGLSLLVLFHILILSRILPSKWIWADKKRSRTALLLSEVLALLINFVALAIVTLYLEYWSVGYRENVARIGFWLLLGYFTANVINSLRSSNPVKRYGYGLFCLVMALLSLRMALA